VADRRDDWKLEANDPAPLEPGPAPAPAKSPVPIPSISTEPSAHSPEIRVLLMWRHFEGPEEADCADELGYTQTNRIQ
jgi:hypothetical protein